jgi:phosphoglycolate phosphatase
VLQRGTLARKRLVVFDLDGTLVDSTEDIAAAFNHTLRRVAPGTPPLGLAVIRALVGHGARNLVERGLAVAGLGLDPARVLPVFLEVYSTCLLDKTRLYPGTAETLEALAGRSLAVLTNKPGGLSRAILAGLGVADRFVRVLGGGDGPASKPDPAGLALLMKEFAVTPAQTLMVGDSPVDVATARAAGVEIAGVLYGLDPASLRAAQPDFMIESPRQLLEVC